MGRLVKAKAGQRLAEALAAIRAFESAQADWGFPELGLAIGCSASQARGLVATLILKGHLAYRETTVRKTLPVLVEQPTADQSQAA